MQSTHRALTEHSQSTHRALTEHSWGQVLHFALVIGMSVFWFEVDRRLF
ncbi:hypothetical protein [Vibrio breoganii]|nr:hypothetical protein [Vibrio breoganii]